jgi:NitT/TauT family transport system substrate-binding protein
MIAEQKRLTRAALLAAAGAVCVAPSSVRAQNLTTIRVGAAPDHNIVAVLWGVQSGIFQRLGLNVEVQKSNSGTAVSSALAGGSIEIGKANVLALSNAHLRGIPFVLQAPGSLYSSVPPDVPSSSFVVAKDSPVSSGRDLNGKTVAVTALGDLYMVAGAAWIDQNGGDSRTVRFLELPNTATADAIAAGRVEAATLAYPALGDALGSGKCRSIGHSFDAIAKRFISTFYFSTADYAKKNGDVLAAFRKGLAESVIYCNAHSAEITPLLAKFIGMDPKAVAAMPREDLWSSLDVRLIQPVIDTAARYKGIPRAFPAREFIDPAALTG